MLGILWVTNHVLLALRPNGTWSYGWNLSQWVAHWVQFDGHRYVEIVENGYSYDPSRESTIAWLPVYPALMWVGTQIGGPAIVWAVIITTASGAAISVLLVRWIRTVGVDGGAWFAVWALVMLSPYAWFLYGVPYPDALYLVLVAGAFLCVERDQVVGATVLVAIATASRPTAVALFAGVVVMQLERSGVVGWEWRRPQWRKVAPRSLIPLAGSAGLLAYMAFLGLRFGDPLAYIDNQKYFHGGGSALGNTSAIRGMLQAWSAASWPLVVLGLAGVLTGIAGAVVAMRRWGLGRGTLCLIATGVLLLAAARWRDMVDYPVLWGSSAAQATLCLAVAASVPAVGRRLGLGYAVYTGVLVALPVIATGNFIGAGRYMLAALPTAVVWGEWLVARPAGRFVPVVTTAAMVALSFGFVNSWYLS